MQRPLIPGHEAIGDVVAVGPGVKEWKVGDRCGASWHGGHDGTCRWCREGMNQACVNESINGVFRDGSCELLSSFSRVIHHVTCEND